MSRFRAVRKLIIRAFPYLTKAGRRAKRLTPHLSVLKEVPLDKGTLIGRVNVNFGNASVFTVASVFLMRGCLTEDEPETPPPPPALIIESETRSLATGEVIKKVVFRATGQTPFTEAQAKALVVQAQGLADAEASTPATGRLTPTSAASAGVVAEAVAFAMLPEEDLAALQLVDEDTEPLQTDFEEVGDAASPLLGGWTRVTWSDARGVVTYGWQHLVSGRVVPDGARVDSPGFMPGGHQPPEA